MRKWISGLLRRGRFHLQVNKIVFISSFINIFEICAILFTMAILYLSGHMNDHASYVPFALAIVSAILGAVFAVRDAQTTTRLLAQTEQLEESLQQVGSLNTEIRAQRHDFLNHLQVVHSLIELSENEEARGYIERVYGEMHKTSRALRTSIVAINALLAAKIGDCEERGIHVDAKIESPWKNLAMPAWEMCRVLGNILDNAMQALEGVAQPSVEITIEEDLWRYSATVSNNGPMIPLSLQESIFEEGITTKKTGQGMGLYIVRETLRDYGGDVMLVSDAGITKFMIWLPRSV